MSEAYFTQLPLGELIPNSYNARRFEENMTPQRRARFAELVESIKGKGIIEPLLVRPLPSGLFEVIAGERRYRAALEVQLTEVPCMVRTVGDDEAFDLMVTENLQREDLTPLETAQAFQAYLQRYGNTAEAVAEISARTGIPTHAIRRQVRLLDLPAEVLGSWRDGALSTSHVELLTRIADRDQVLELYSACLRSKLTVRELTERIGIACPELSRGFFDKIECQTCHYNTAVQSGLFADSASDSKCGHSVCFEAKQSKFLTANWQQSKAAAAFGTRGFRFGHRLGQESREPLTGKETAPRCLDCDLFVSVIRLTGVVVSGYDRVCAGPRKCFEELYCAPQISSTPEPEKSEEVQPVAPQVDEKPAGPTKTSPPETKAPEQPKSAPGKAETRAPQTKTPDPPLETGPVYNGPRGEKAREEYFQAHLPGKVQAAEADDLRVISLALLALTISSSPAKAAFAAHAGIEIPASHSELAKAVFDQLDDGDIYAALQAASLGTVMKEAGVREPVRRAVATSFGLSISGWSMTKEYLDSLNKSEIIRIGEEPGVGIWEDEKLKASRKERFKGRALVTLKKEDLVDLILKSGANLAGRVPAEVLGERKG